MPWGSYALQPGVYTEIPGSDDFEASGSIAPSSSLEFPAPSFEFLPAHFKNIEFFEDDNQDSPYIPSEEQWGQTDDNLVFCMGNPRVFLAVPIPVPVAGNPRVCNYIR